MAIVAGAILAILPSTAANATTASVERALWAGKVRGLQFVVTNDTSQILTEWRIEFDLPADTQPTWWEPIYYWLTVTPTATGYHVTADTERASHTFQIYPGRTFLFGIVTNGPSLPANCVVDGVVPCTVVT